MNQNAFKIAFIGTHGVGKTTLCFGLAARLKRTDVVLDVVGEVARRCPLPINRDTTFEAQAWILHSQIGDELVASSRYDVVICDRSVLDNYVYLLLSNGPQVSLEHLVDSWLRTYDLLVHVPILHQPRADGLRSTDPMFQSAVADRLLKEIEQRQITALDLTGADREDWLNRVETEVRDRLGPHQLELP